MDSPQHFHINAYARRHKACNLRDGASQSRCLAIAPNPTLVPTTLLTAAAPAPAAPCPQQFEVPVVWIWPTWRCAASPPYCCATLRSPPLVAEAKQMAAWQHEEQGAGMAGAVHQGWTKHYQRSSQGTVRGMAHAARTSPRWLGRPQPPWAREHQS